MMKRQEDSEGSGVGVQGSGKSPVKFDPARVREEFPILSTTAHGKPLVYLDNGATTQKPRRVIEAIERYYAAQNANIHRGVYDLSQTSTLLYEQARHKVREFINAREPAEIIFTRGTTEGINLVASSWGRPNLRSGDEVIVSAMEHHSNIVPWQMACEAAGAKLRVIPINDRGELRMDEFERMLSPRVKMVAVVHLSNSLGTINDVKRITQMAHNVGAKVLIDGAQWVAHFPTDVQEIGCDFYTFSGHKLYGPTGIGVLYGRREQLDAMPPYQGGGDMIESVTFEKTTYAQLPNKFEAGTPHIEGAIGLGEAIDYVSSLNFSFVDHEHDLLEYATQKLGEIPGLRIVGTAEHKGSVVSFVMEQPAISSLDIGAKLDNEGIAVRTGHHCCQPVMERFGIPGTARASLAMYNTREDVDRLVEGLKKIASDAAAKRKSEIRNPKSDTSSKFEISNLKFPAASAASPRTAADELVSDFEVLGDWEERYQYVVEMGEKLLPMPVELKNEATRVHGCQSIVHLIGRKKSGSRDVLEFLADSDADIVRGLIAILERVFSGQRAAEIKAFDIEEFFRRLGLDQYLTTGRRNGLASMVQRIRAHAAVIEAASAKPEAVA